MIASLLMTLAAYGLGSISFAIVISKLMRLPDPTTYGSGNPGATNVLRSGNKAAAVGTLVGDFLKGAAVVALGQHLAPQFGWGDWTVAASALAVFLGHLWPVWHRFKGGKGVATAAGVLMALSLWLGLATLLTWLIIAFFFRYSSLAALVSAVFAVFYQILLFGFGPITLCVMIMAVLLIVRHRVNIEKLLRGTESRIGQRKPKD